MATTLGHVRTDRQQRMGGKKKEGVVMEFNEWLRIRNGLKKAEDDAKRREKKVLEQQALQEMSKSLVKNWENTIEGQRLKKLEARKIREEKEEEEKVKVDIEEAKFQAMKRKEAIERAKTLLYYQTDRVKKFHGALKLSEVLAEREQQITRKKKKEDIQKKIDANFLAIEAEEREQAILRDMEEAERAIKAKNEIKAYQMQQVAKKTHMKKEERQAALDEQKKIEEEVRQYYQQRKLIEEEMQRQKQVYRKNLDQTLAEQNAIRDAGKRERLLEEKEIKLFADAKKKMMKLRKDQEMAIFSKFQDQQQVMCGKLQEKLQKQQDGEDEKIAMAIEENEMKRLAEEKRKAEDFVAMNTDIFKHRMKIINENVEKVKEEADKEKLLLKQRVLADQKFHESQLAKQQKKFVKAKGLQEYHQLQMKGVVAHKNKDLEEEHDYYSKNLELMKVEEEQFQEYANKVINEAKQRKANIKPLKKTAHPGAGAGHGPVFESKGGVRPSYMAKDITHTELPAYGSRPLLTKSVNTHKRMGFNW